MIGEEAHEGWNYYDMKDLNEDKILPKYSAYRLMSAVAKGCDDLGEIRFIGHEVIDDSNTEYTCEAEIKTYTIDPDTGSKV